MLPAKRLMTLRAIFQSHIGAIRILEAQARLRAELYFNPTLVQLECHVVLSVSVGVPHFNPTLVQLEFLTLSVFAIGFVSFQSHIGAIRISYTKKVSCV